MPFSFAAARSFSYFCVVKTLFVVLGALSLLLGLVGIFVPLLPTTPFLLLAAALWVRSSPRLYAWLLAHRRLGPYIRNFRENRAIPLRAKILSVTLLWATLLCWPWPSASRGTSSRSLPCAGRGAPAVEVVSGKGLLRKR